MRGIGAAAILLASLSGGLLAARQKRMRLRCLRDLSELLTCMAAELSGKRAPLPELIDTCRLYASGDARGFLENMKKNLPLLGEASFSGLWTDSAEQTLTRLREEEYREWIQLGRQLGRVELERQMASLESCRASLSMRLAREEQLYQNDRRLCLGLPAAAGALLLILLF